MKFFKNVLWLLLGIVFIYFDQATAQALRLPDATNPHCTAGRRLGVTDIEISWNAPGMKGRDGRIWGTPVAHYGFTVLGFGSNTASPWRAGANECTTISFSTDVRINGIPLSAGKYALFMALYADSVTLIFSKNIHEWGSYFYQVEDDVLRVTTHQQKDLPFAQELLTYTFHDQTDRSVLVSLEWERWRIPFRVEVDVVQTTLAAIQAQMSGALGFDPPSLQAAAQWCLANEVNLQEAFNWITTASDPNLGGLQTFPVLSTKAGLLRKLGRTSEADAAIKAAVANAKVLELHAYGRQLIGEKKYPEALEIFKLNLQKHGDVWPVHVGLMRGYSAVGDLNNALKHARLAIQQAPDEMNKNNLQNMLKTLEAGKPIAQ